MTVAEHGHLTRLRLAPGSIRQTQRRQKLSHRKRGITLMT